MMRTEKLTDMQIRHEAVKSRLIKFLDTSGMLVEGLSHQLFIPVKAAYRFFATNSEYLRRLEKEGVIKLQLNAHGQTNKNMMLDIENFMKCIIIFKNGPTSRKATIYELKGEVKTFTEDDYKIIEDWLTKVSLGPTEG